MAEDAGGANVYLTPRATEWADSEAMVLAQMLEAGASNWEEMEERLLAEAADAGDEVAQGLRATSKKWNDMFGPQPPPRAFPGSGGGGGGGDDDDDDDDESEYEESDGGVEEKKLSAEEEAARIKRAYKKQEARDQRARELRGAQRLEEKMLEHAALLRQRQFEKVKASLDTEAASLEAREENIDAKAAEVEARRAMLLEAKTVLVAQLEEARRAQAEKHREIGRLALQRDMSMQELNKILAAGRSGVGGAASDVAPDGSPVAASGKAPAPASSPSSSGPASAKVSPLANDTAETNGDGGVAAAEIKEKAAAERGGMCSMDEWCSVM